MRVFVGTMLEASAQQWCRTHVDALVGQHPDALRSIPAGTAHLTHFFCASLGDVPLDTLLAAVRGTTERWPAFDIRLGGLRAIPPGPRARLIALEVPAGGSETMRLSQALVAGVRRACPALSVDPAKSSHITLARFRRQAGARQGRAVTSALESLSRTMGQRVQHVDNVEVIRSTLRETGPTYDVLHRLPLASGGAA